MASSSLHCLTVLTEEDGVPGSKFEREPEEYTVDQLKRWLKCRGLKLSGKREDLVQRVRGCVRSGNYHTLDQAIDHGEWFAAKVLQENSDVKTNSGSISIPCIPSTGWRVFPSQNIPSLFNYGHVLSLLQTVSFGITWLWCNNWRPYHMYFFFWVCRTICSPRMHIAHCYYGSCNTCSISPLSPASYPDLCGTIESELVEESIQPSLYCQEEIDAAEALLSATSVVSSASKCASEQGQKLTVFPWGGLTSTGISLTNTCPLDNWLMIFQALTKSHKVELSDLPESAHIIGTSLKLIDDGLHADAKLLILQSIPQWQQLRGTHKLFFFFF